MVRYSNSLFLSLVTASSGKENNSREWCEKKTAGGGPTTCVWYALHLVCLYSSQLLLLIVKLLAVVGGRKSFSGFLFFFKQLIKLFHVTWEETSVFICYCQTDYGHLDPSTCIELVHFVKALQILRKNLGYFLKIFTQVKKHKSYIHN